MTEDIDPVMIDVPVPIVTPRLVLRPPQAGDGAETAAAVEETFEQLYEWMLWAEKKENNTPEKQEIRARRCAAQFILREDIALKGFEKDTGRMVVWTGLHAINWRRRHFMIGYWVRKSAQGRGYATESTNALLRYAFGALAAERVEITHAEGNVGSRKVIAKLGFEKEGVRRSGILLPGGRVRDAYVYARLNANGLPPLEVRWGSP